MSAPIKYLTIAAGMGFVAGLLTMYAAVSGSSSDTLPALASVPTHTITVPVVAQDKPALRKAGAISRKVEKDPAKEVLGTGTVRDDSGSRTVAAVLDKPSGVTVITSERPWAEWMNRHELGLGYGWKDGDLVRGLEYRWTFARCWHFYATTDVRALDDRSWIGMVWASVRF